MPRANRFSLPGHVWHITHRCHQREFLLKFSSDRERWRRWLFEARKRFKLCVLNYVVTSNHIHLLVLDHDDDEIPRSMQLIAGRTAQDYNRRKGRRGAYWEDRYHATAVDTGDYLARCMRYIDLNMVRAGAVDHPGDWDVCGYREIQHPPRRYRIIDTDALQRLLNIPDLETLQRSHRDWISDALRSNASPRDESWSKSLAVGSRTFVQRFQMEAGARALHRSVINKGEQYLLREEPAVYTANSREEKAVSSAENTVLLGEF